ncbi:hypothetical protein HYY70_06910 [Candidatus Woesearchaeota archaeon]|nr:hypothetical protein [Candidatus Woesearchaeota archaeon]
MSLLSKVTAPFRFVENEFEALVHSLYSVYNKRTGRDQYSLSNFYFDGAAFYMGLETFLRKGLVPEIGFYLLCSPGFRILNNEFKSEDGLSAKSTEGAKNYLREVNRAFMKMMGRAALTDYIATVPLITYSDLSSTKLFDLSIPFGYLTLSLLAFGAYTSAIDTNNPKKSKIAAKVREWRQSRKRTQERRIDDSEGLPQEIFAFIPQP